MRDQFGAVIPGQSPPSPPLPVGGAPHPGIGRPGRRARAAMLAQFGGNTVTPFVGGASVEVRLTETDSRARVLPNNIRIFLGNRCLQILDAREYFV
jgi:hypothetical protein